jgi:hypothetical protein
MGRWRVKPIISTTPLTCVTTVGSKVITSAALFGSVTQGMRLVGAGIPFNSKVVTKTSTSSITIDNAATATSAAVTLRFGYFTSAAYATGNTLGFPFQVGLDKVNDIIVTDVAKQLTKLKLYFFDAPFTEVADHAAFAPLAADAAKVIGYVEITANQTLTNFNLMNYGTEFNLGGIDLPWCQAVVDGDSPTFAHVNDVCINFIGDGHS